MISFEIGKLYVCSEYHLLVLPTENKAIRATEHETIAAARHFDSRTWPEWWKKTSSRDISHLPAGQVFCVVENNQPKIESGFCQVRVIFGETIGWINITNWMNIQELVA